jgi:GNAT superfamily N-acetyltransferase/RimJ/RimL family protein N-acetyltransferase
MNIERFDAAADAAAVRACHEIDLAAAQADQQRLPRLSSRVFEGWLSTGWSADPLQNWLARDNTGEVSGFCQVKLPERENRHTARLTVEVHPSRRRAGLGTALVAHAAGLARQAGRTLLTGGTDEPFAGLAPDGQISPGQASAGQAFALALGARPRQCGFCRVLRLALMPADRLAVLRERAEAAARGYELLPWTGDTPADLLPAVAALFDAEADAPHAAGQEPEVWDPARVREEEARIAAHGFHCYTVAARPESSQDPVAITQVVVDPAQHGWAIQDLTAVVRGHRGHRLGMLVKLAMLDLLAEREPQITQIMTHNADGNEHMAAINAELGYEFLQVSMDWEVEVARVPTLTDLAAPGTAAP